MLNCYSQHILEKKMISMYDMIQMCDTYIQIN